MSWQDRLREELEARRGNPYEPRGCLLFAASVYDALEGIETPLPSVVTNPAIDKSPNASHAAYRALLERYAVTSIPLDLDLVEPGDAIVFKRFGTNAVGHVGIVGLRRGEVWHNAPKIGVRPTSWGATHTLFLHAWRFDGREDW